VTRRQRVHSHELYQTDSCEIQRSRQREILEFQHKQLKLTAFSQRKIFGVCQQKQLRLSAFCSAAQQIILEFAKATKTNRSRQKGLSCTVPGLKAKTDHLCEYREELQTDTKSDLKRQCSWGNSLVYSSGALILCENIEKFEWQNCRTTVHIKETNSGRKSSLSHSPN
jgi:hypothetical protein